VFTISITDVNEPPTLTCSQASVSGNVLSTLTNTGTWFDPEGRILSMSASLGGVSWTSNGTWTWTFVPTQRYTAQTVTITATDEDFSTQISFEITTFNTVVDRGVYYIGHLMGETNGLIEGGAFMVRGTDTASIISRIDNDTRVTVDNVYDINKDGRIRGSDSAAAVAAIGRTLTRITIPPAGGWIVATVRQTVDNQMVARPS
jgi:hypothetical protein